MRRVLPSLAHLSKALLIAVCLLLTTGNILPGSVPASAHLDQAYDLGWWSVDGGGGTLSGTGPAGTYTLTGTAGQPDAGVLQGGDYVLDGGCLGGGQVPGPVYDHRIYLPIVIRSSP